MESRVSREVRKSFTFLRNMKEETGRYNLPLIKRQNINLMDAKLLSFSDIHPNDTVENKKKGVHFFIDDYRFEGVYNNPERKLGILSQYSFLLTPDFSLYCEMPLWRQIENAAKNRWCGAFWQSKGLNVVPTISWSNSLSYDFCFDGVEKDSIVSVSTVGCMKNKLAFLRGYEQMLKVLSPNCIICYGTPMKEMKGNILTIEYKYLHEREVL